MDIPYDKIIAIKVLYDDIPKKGIINRLKRAIYDHEMSKITRLLWDSLENNTVVYKQDLIKFCNFIRSTPLWKSDTNMKIDIYDENTYKITIDERWGRYTRIDISGTDIHGIDISSTNPNSDLLSKHTNGIVINRSKTENKIYESMLSLIMEYIYM